MVHVLADHGPGEGAVHADAHIGAAVGKDAGEWLDVRRCCGGVLIHLLFKFIK